MRLMAILTGILLIAVFLLIPCFGTCEDLPQKIKEVRKRSGVKSILLAFKYSGHTIPNSESSSALVLFNETGVQNPSASQALSQDIHIRRSPCLLQTS